MPSPPACSMDSDYDYEDSNSIVSDTSDNSWVEEEETPRSRRSAFLPRLSLAGALFGAGTRVKELAEDHSSFDNDGFCALVKHGSLSQLVAAVGGFKHSISPVAAHHAENRKLYSPHEFAMVGLGWPDRRQGLGLCVQRNSSGLSRKDIGRPCAGGGFVSAADVDEGLEILHSLLSSDDSQQQRIDGLKRLSAGHCGVWADHEPEYLYKVLQAAAEAHLDVIIFEIGSKANPHIQLPAWEAAANSGSLLWTDYAAEVAGPAGMWSYTSSPEPSFAAVSQWYETKQPARGATFKVRCATDEKYAC